MKNKKRLLFALVTPTTFLIALITVFFIPAKTYSFVLKAPLSSYPTNSLVASSILTETVVFTLTGNLNQARVLHTATLLSNDKVLITGGYNATNPKLTFDSAEIYDPITGVFTYTNNMNQTRVHHTATLLPNGKVLIVGGRDFVSQSSFDSAELYDPVTEIFTYTGSMSQDRFSHSATLLNNGKVLIAGGYSDITTLSSSEIYDPVTGEFSDSDSLNQARQIHTATLLPDGNVLLSGGISMGYEVLSSTEIYEPSTDVFTDTGSLNQSRYWHTATLLPNNKVLLAGGAGPGDLASAELYDIGSGTFGPADSMNQIRIDHTETVLPSGNVLMIGGKWPALDSAEIYDFANNSFHIAGALNKEHAWHTTTMLANGKVLVAGGYGTGGIATNWAEIGTIIPPEPPLPTAAFTGTPLTGIAPLDVQFTDGSTGVVDSWLWEFGDGSGSMSQNPLYTYSLAGTYSVSLTVSNTGGLDTLIRNNYITVYEAVVADFVGNPKSGTEGLTVDFTNLSTGDVDTCLWDFGDGGISTNCNNPSHNYLNDGVYTVSLTVNGLGGESNTETKVDYITVFETVFEKVFLPVIFRPPILVTGDVIVTNIYYDGIGNGEPDEYVQIQNKESQSIQLNAWSLRDDEGTVFTFPDFVIQPGQVCRVYTDEFHPEWCGFNFESGSAIWNNDGDCAFLRDSTGAPVDTYCYP